jgi:hypothetical protein
MSEKSEINPLHLSASLQGALKAQRQAMPLARGQGL